ncbi:Rid family hydrolase [Parasphingorhabdus sp.]|uniref:Rid family hydrolase n=1 Tax=Parasphingorhabdus sp. TaxID=2709688 RepID=UPI003A95BEDF
MKRMIAFSLGSVLACLVAACSPAAEEVPVEEQAALETLMPEDPEALAFQEAVGYSDAVIVGDLVILSGVMAGPMEGDEGMQPAFTRAFDQIGSTLERAGVGWDDVVELETFHAGPMGPQLDEFVQVKNRFITAPFPAWTAVGVTELYEPTALVEIKITAKR